MLDLSSPTIYNQPSIKADYSPDGLEKRLKFFSGFPRQHQLQRLLVHRLPGHAPLDVTFTDSSTGTSITNRRWDFGDGKSPTMLQRPTPPTGTLAGTYTVNLTVTNAGGSNLQLRSNYISVSAAPPAAPVAAFMVHRLPGLLLLM